MEVLNLAISVFVIQILALPIHALPKDIWDNLNGIQIFISIQYRQNWFEAMNECSRKNMSLIGIGSAEKSSTLTYLLTRSYNIYSNVIPEFWIGGNDLATEGDYVWSSTGKRIEFTNWSANEPNDAQSNEDCMMIHMKSFEWNDIDCSAKVNGFICEENPFAVSARRELDTIKTSINQLFADCDD